MLDGALFEVFGVPIARRVDHGNAGGGNGDGRLALFTPLPFVQDQTVWLAPGYIPDRCIYGAEVSVA